MIPKVVQVDLEVCGILDVGLRQREKNVGSQAVKWRVLGIWYEYSSRVSNETSKILKVIYEKISLGTSDLNQQETQWIVKKVPFIKVCPNQKLLIQDKLKI